MTGGLRVLDPFVRAIVEAEYWRPRLLLVKPQRLTNVAPEANEAQGVPLHALLPDADHEVEVASGHRNVQAVLLNYARDDRLVAVAQPVCAEDGAGPVVASMS